MHSRHSIRNCHNTSSKPFQSFTIVERVLTWKVCICLFRVHVIKPALLLPRKKPPKIDDTHPLWNSRKCHIFGDTNVLVEGMPQAQVLTKTVSVNGLPEKLQTSIDNIEISRETDRNMKNAILAAHLFDTEQQKLEKLKDPLRPAWNFPRVYGITRQRKK